MTALTPVWDAHAAHHAALSADWDQSWAAARDALTSSVASATMPRYLTWAELTRTGRKSAALDVLAPVQDRRVAS